MSDYEVPEPIICSPYEEPSHHWLIKEGEPPVLRDGRRESVYFYPTPGDASRTDGVTPGTMIELKLVTLIRKRLAEWRNEGYLGATRTTTELLDYWRRDDRRHQLFFAQVEAAETVIFLHEARRDYLQGIDVPSDEPSERQKDA